MHRDDPTIQGMRKRAVAAAQRAYAPYSGFRVGAALLAENGGIFVGCNVENASYSLAMCAERNALFQAVAAGHRGISALVIYTPTEHPTLPCGACRQVLNEFGPDAEVFSFAAGGEWAHARLRDLLPSPFGPSDLGSDPEPQTTPVR